MAMKLNISYPKHGSNKMVEVEDEKKLRIFADKRICEEVPGDSLGDDFKGYVFKITGGFDKQGFAMVQGVATNGRVRLMLDGRTGMYTPKRPGCRKRKSIRGCIIGTDLSCINLTIVRKGPTDLPGLTDPDSNKPSMRGPKRAAKIRKLWGLTKADDVRLFVPKRKVSKDGKKEQVKSPKIQRLVTPITVRRKKQRIADKKDRFTRNQEQKAKYEQILAQVRKEKRAALLSKKRELQSERKSSLVVKAGAPAAAKAAVPAKGAAPAKAAAPAKGAVAAKPDAKAAAPAKGAAPAKTDAKAAPAKTDAKAAPAKSDAKAAAPAKGAAPAKTDAKAAAPAKTDAKAAAPAKGAAPAKTDAKAPAPAKTDAKPAPAKTDAKAPAPAKTDAKPAQPAQPAAPAKADAKPAQPAPQQPAQQQQKAQAKPAQPAQSAPKGGNQKGGQKKQ
jgi:ribosomal protein S6E (S10)